jgi:transcription elongation factor
MNRTILSIATAALLILGACNKKSENPPPGPSGGTMAGSGSAAPAAGSAAPAAGSGSAAPAAGSGSAVPAAGSGSAAPAAGSGSAAPAAGSGSATAAVDVPTEEDFEDDAKTKITDKNVEAQVVVIEKQLAPDTK